MTPPSKFFTALAGADQRIDEIDARNAEREVIRTAFAAAVGFYDCPCGSDFEFAADSTLEDYAALNRWLGHHLNLCTVDDAPRTQSSSAVTGMPAEDRPAPISPRQGAGHQHVAIETGHDIGLSAAAEFFPQHTRK